MAIVSKPKPKWDHDAVNGIINGYIEDSADIDIRKWFEEYLDEQTKAHGTGRGCAYTLSGKVCRHASQKAAYVRQAGFEPIQQEQMVLCCRHDTSMSDC